METDIVLPVTGEQLKQSMMTAGILSVVQYECSTCKLPITYYRKHDKLYLDCSCKCKEYQLISSQWDDAASWVNGHTRELAIALAGRFGLWCKATE